MFNPFPYGFPAGASGYQNPFAPASIQPPAQQPAANMLPPQQILQANGRQSIEALRMPPNSSVYIEDATANNLVWKCVSDSLGQVTSKAFDLTPHEEAPIIDHNGLLAIVAQMNDRLTKVEELTHARQDLIPAAAPGAAGTGAKTAAAPKSAAPRNAAANGS